MKHEYLRELLDGNLFFPYDEEDYHDFDKRDTYNMMITLVAWLYECLRYFEEEASKKVNFDFHKCNIDGEELTQMQCIHRMVDDCTVFLKCDEYEDYDKMDAAMRDLFKVFSEVFWAMWW